MPFISTQNLSKITNKTAAFQALIFNARIHPGGSNCLIFTINLPISTRHIYNISWQYHTAKYCSHLIIISHAILGCLKPRRDSGMFWERYSSSSLGWSGRTTHIAFQLIKKKFNIMYFEVIIMSYRFLSTTMSSPSKCKFVIDYFSQSANLKKEAY